MWESIAPVGALVSDHLMLGGLGGVITVIVGGIASVIAWRSSKRAVARPAPSPAPSPEARPVSRRAAPPIGYGESAPPTSPARRLYPGPISMRGATPPQPEPAQDENASQASFFNPDLLSSASTEEPPFVAPVWRSNSAIMEEWRAQEHPTPDVMPLHRPFWTSVSLTRASAIADLGASYLGDEAPLPIDPSLQIEPPIWDSGFRGARVQLASLSTDALELGDAPMSAPVWTSHGAPSALPGADYSIPADAVADEDAIECEPPIWSSFSDRTP